jgi:hypothetical protein
MNPSSPLLRSPPVVVEQVVSGRSRCATAHASHGWSSRHRRPTLRGAGLGLFGLSWADSDGMTGVFTAATRQPRLACLASILEPEVPAGGFKSHVRCFGDSGYGCGCDK